MTDSVTVNSGDPSVDVDVVTPSIDVLDDPRAVDVDQQSLEVDVDSGGYTSLDYRTLANKPSINEVTLVGDKSLEEIGVGRITNQDIWNIVGRRR